MGSNDSGSGPAGREQDREAEAEARAAPGGARRRAAAYLDLWERQVQLIAAQHRFSRGGAATDRERSE